MSSIKSIKPRALQNKSMQRPRSRFPTSIRRCTTFPRDRLLNYLVLPRLHSFLLEVPTSCQTELWGSHLKLMSVLISNSNKRKPCLLNEWELKDFLVTENFQSRSESGWSSQRDLAATIPFHYSWKWPSKS
jgi:hypothetical protein